MYLNARVVFLLKPVLGGFWMFKGSKNTTSERAIFLNLYTRGPCRKPTSGRFQGYPLETRVKRVSGFPRLARAERLTGALSVPTDWRKGLKADEKEPPKGPTT